MPDPLPETRAAGRVGLAGVQGPGVLIVESDPDLQWTLARSLTVTGCRVVGTSSGDGALAVLSAWAADVIVIAEDLPGMSGLELARRVRGLVAATPIVLLANDGPGAADVAASTGATHVLRKPVGPDEIRALVLRHRSL